MAAVSAARAAGTVLGGVDALSPLPGVVSAVLGVVNKVISQLDAMEENEQLAR